MSTQVFSINELVLPIFLQTGFKIEPEVLSHLLVSGQELRLFMSRDGTRLEGWFTRHDTNQDPRELP